MNFDEIRILLKFDGTQKIEFCQIHPLRDSLSFAASYNTAFTLRNRASISRILIGIMDLNSLSFSTHV